MTREEIFTCGICFKDFETLSLCEDHITTEHKTELSEEDNPEWFVIVREKGEELSIEEGEEKNLDEIDVISEEDLITLGEAKRALEIYPDLDETTKKQVLSRVLGISLGKKHDKKFQPQIKIKDVDEHYLHRIKELVEDGSCPFCREHFSQASFYEGISLPEELSELRPIPQLKTLPSEKQGGKTFDWVRAKEHKIPLTISHIRSKHGGLFQILKDVFEGILPTTSFATTPNPESCSQEEDLDLENLSEEELYDKAIQDESFRKSLFKRWLMEKQKRKE